MTPPKSEHLFWSALLVAGTAYECRAVRGRPDATLSDVTRSVFHTHTRAGRLAFTCVWGGFTAWYAHHILRELA